MLKTLLFNLVLFVFLCASFGAATVSAQRNSCAVKMDVTRVDSDAMINGAGATAVNSKTKRTYNSVLRGGMPFFGRLPEGNYRVTVSKAGFKKSIDDFNLSCEDNDDPWYIELYRGSSRQIVKLYNIPPRRISSIVLKSRPLSQNEVQSVPKGAANEDEMPPPVPKPTPPPPPKALPKVISGGIVNGKAINLVKPAYPPAARAVRASGAVNVQVTIDEEGNVISATAVSGHPLLRAAAVKAARESKFSPTMLSGQPVKVTGVIVYNFIPPEPKKEDQ